MRPKQIRLLFACVLFGLGLSTAHADKLDDNLQTVWESLWDQRGTPRSLMRWEQPITYRIHGADSARHRQHIESALKAATDIARIQVMDISQNTDSQATANLDLEVVTDSELEDNLPCITRFIRFSGGALTHVQIKMRSRTTWNCAFHEMMHAMGIVGHPSGKTVLSYFPHRRDVFMDMDKLMLAAWYSPEMRKNATPLEALAVLTRAVASQTDLDLPAGVAASRAHDFNLNMLRQMEALATGDGEVPAIVLRSGRASQIFLQQARPMAAYFVGMAYFRGTIVAKDQAASSPWFQRAARKGFIAAQIMWGNALVNGTGVPVDRPAGHAWLTLAAKSLPAAANVLASAEKKMSADELRQARALPAPSIDPP